jgi:two-component system NtrC family response regulator
VQITLPPLRDRENDIRLLAQFFLNRFAQQVNKTNMAFEPDAVKGLNRHGWPGNIRELENCIRRAVIMADGRRVTAKDLELDASELDPNLVTLKDAREAVERQMVQRALLKYSGKIAPAAVELGLSRPTLYELMDKLGISRSG